MISMASLSEIVEKVGPWESKWREKEFNAFRDFLQSLKLWAETSIIKGIREETKYPDEILISPEDEAKSRRIEEAVADPKVSPEYKIDYVAQQRYLDWLWKITQQKTSLAVSMLPKEMIQSIIEDELDGQDWSDIKQRLNYRYSSGTMPQLKMESLYPTYVQKEGWKDEQGMSWKDYKDIMERTLLRYLRTQKDVDYIGRTVGDYLGAETDWMIYRSEDKKIDKPPSNWELLLNPQEITNMEIYRILYEQDAIDEMIAEMIIPLYRFELFEPAIKLQELSIQSNYTSTDDDQAMRDELSNDEEYELDEGYDGNTGDYYEEVKNDPRIVMHQSNIDWKYEHGEFYGTAKEVNYDVDGVQFGQRPIGPQIKYPFLYGDQHRGGPLGKNVTEPWKGGSRSPWFPYGLIKNSSEMANYHIKKYRNTHKIVERLPEDAGVKYPIRTFKVTPYTLESTLMWNNNDIGPILPEVEPEPELPPFLAASPDGSRPLNEKMPLPQYRAKRERIQRIYDRQIELWKKEAPQIPTFDTEEIGLQDIDIKVSIELRSQGLRLINYVLRNSKIIPN